MARINLHAMVDQATFPDAVWDWLDLLGDILVNTQKEALVHETYVADDPFKRLLLWDVNRMIGSLNSIYILLRMDLIDLAAAQVRILCEAVITLCYVARDPGSLAPQFWGYYIIEAFELGTNMIEMETGRAKPEHILQMKEWLNNLQPEYEKAKRRYTYVDSKGKSRPYINWCNRQVAKQAEDCGGEFPRLYKLVYKQLSSYVHCSAFSLRRQAAYSRVHYDVTLVHLDVSTIVRTTAIVWLEMAKFLSEACEWDLNDAGVAVAKRVAELEEGHGSDRPAPRVR